MDLGSHGSVGIAGRVAQESGAGAARGGIFSGASNQISLMKWGRCSSRPGRKPPSLSAPGDIDTALPRSTSFSRNFSTLFFHNPPLDNNILNDYNVLSQ